MHAISITVQASLYAFGFEASLNGDSARTPVADGVNQLEPMQLEFAESPFAEGAGRLGGDTLASVVRSNPVGALSEAIGQI
jgi:hypothetical protein